MSNRPESQELDEVCPKCGSTMLLNIWPNGGKNKACSDWQNCGHKEYVNETVEGFSSFSKGFKNTKDGVEFIIWKNSFGRDFTEEEAQKLFNGEELNFDNFTKKDGSTYQATVLFSYDEKKLTFKQN